MKKLTVRTKSRCELIDITAEAQDAVREAGVKNGLCHIYVPHTTAGITINEGADPSVRSDMLMQLEKMVPREAGYNHSEGNSDAHVKATLVGPSQTLIVENGNITLGTWQSIYFCEFDGPRARTVFVHAAE